MDQKTTPSLWLHHHEDEGWPVLVEHLWRDRSHALVGGFVPPPTQAELHKKDETVKGFYQHYVHESLPLPGSFDSSLSIWNTTLGTQTTRTQEILYSVKGSRPQAQASKMPGECC